MRHRIVYFDKQVVDFIHFFEILPQLRMLEKHHHLISPFMYSEAQTKLRSMKLLMGQ